MNTNRKIIAAVLCGVALMVASASTASACGFLGCIVNSVAPGAGDQLDRLHEQMGKPGDRAIDAAKRAAEQAVEDALEE